LCVRPDRHLPVLRRKQKSSEAQAIMIWPRISRTVVSVVSAVLLTAGSAGFPLASLAEQPAWRVTAQSLPGRVGNDDTAGYLVRISNGQRGNISALSLHAATPSGTTFLSASPSAGSCTGSGPLSCTLGALAKGASVTVLAVYRTPATGPRLTVTFEATATRASTNDNPGTNHVDVQQKEGVTVLSSNPEFGGRFVFDESQLDVFNDQEIGGTNQHATMVHAPTTGIPVTVKDTNADAGCPTELACFGKASEIHVAGGTVFPDGFLVTVTFGPGELPLVWGEGGPSPITAADLDIWHQLDDLSGAPIYRCPTGGAASITAVAPSPGDLPCFTAEDRYGGGITAFVWLTENGNIKGY
jgi:uncharacterized protein DUF11